MKKLMICLLAGVLAAPVSAGPFLKSFAGETFSTRGQCESAIVKERDDRRADKANPAMYNHKIHDRFACEETVDGAWIVVRD